MSNGRFLLDTNIVVAAMANEAVLLRRLAQRPTIFVSVVTLGELYYGARKSSRIGKNLRRITRFLTETAVVDCDAETAFEYGQLRDELRIKGRPLPENDVWIAAIARQHSMTLVTRDKHFAHVDGLIVEVW